MVKKNDNDIGLKIGIEIHQQLKGTKLFCRCPAEITEKKEFSVKRRLHTSAGELGRIDVAAAKEHEKGKYFRYTGAQAHSCLVDLDEAPPLSLSEEALTTVLQVARMLDAQMLDACQTMRKIVIDGSNTSGFQRTCLVAMNGSIDSSLGKIRVPTIIVEEDSAQKREESAEYVEYNLDRLGIPLIEIGTLPDIQTPEHCGEVAEKLGSLLRSTGRVRRGLGTIRQDVNVSIRGGTRVEIKGAQDLHLIPTLVREEVSRQQQLIALKEEFSQGKVKVGSVVDVTAVFAHSGSRVVSSVLERKGVVLGLCLSHGSGLLGRELQGGRRFGTELSNYARVHAGVNGLFHSDELPNYGITQQEVDAARKALSCSNDDAFILVAESEKKANDAMKVIRERFMQALRGVPPEVRNALPSGASEYLRPLPGASRMYPETDVPLIVLDKKTIASLPLPELISERVNRYKGYGLAHDLATLAAKSESFPVFDDLASRLKSLKPSYIAEVLFTARKAVKRQGGGEISDDDVREVLEALDRGQITKGAIIPLLSEGKSVEEILPHYAVFSLDVLEKKVRDLAKKKSSLPFEKLVGVVMKELGYRASGEDVLSLLKRMAKK